MLLHLTKAPFIYFRLCTGMAPHHQPLSRHLSLEKSHPASHGSSSSVVSKREHMHHIVDESLGSEFKTFYKLTSPVKKTIPLLSEVKKNSPRQSQLHNLKSHQSFDHYWTRLRHEVTEMFHTWHTCLTCSRVAGSRLGLRLHLSTFLLRVSTRFWGERLRLNPDPWREDATEAWWRHRLQLHSTVATNRCLTRLTVMAAW